MAYIEVATLTYELALAGKPDNVVEVSNRYIVDSDLQKMVDVFREKVGDFKHTIKCKLVQEEILSAETRVMLITLSEQLDAVHQGLHNSKQVILSISPDIFVMRDLFPKYMNRGLIVKRKCTIERIKDIRPSSI